MKGRQSIQNYNEKYKIPVIYCDTGLLDLLNILRTKKCSVALVHKDNRRQLDTNIAYLDVRIYLNI